MNTREGRNLNVEIDGRPEKDNNRSKVKVKLNLANLFPNKVKKVHLRNPEVNTEEGKDTTEEEDTKGENIEEKLKKCSTKVNKNKSSNKNNLKTN